MMDSDVPINRLVRIIDFDLLTVDVFNYIEEDIYEFVSRKVIKNQLNSK